MLSRINDTGTAIGLLKLGDNALSLDKSTATSRADECDKTLAR